MLTLLFLAGGGGGEEKATCSGDKLQWIGSMHPLVLRLMHELVLNVTWMEWHTIVMEQPQNLRKKPPALVIELAAIWLEKFRHSPWDNQYSYTVAIFLTLKSQVT